MSFVDIAVQREVWRLILPYCEYGSILSLIRTGSGLISHACARLDKILFLDSSAKMEQLLDVTPMSKSFPVLRELIFGTGTFESTWRMTEFAQQIPKTLTRLHLPQNIVFGDEIVSSLPDLIQDLDIKIKGRTWASKIAIEETENHFSKLTRDTSHVGLPSSLTRLKIESFGDPVPIYLSLPRSVTDFSETSQTFGIPPPWFLLPPNLVSMSCQLYMFTKSLSSQLPRGLSSLKLKITNTCEIEVLRALPPALTNLDLNVTMSSKTFPTIYSMELLLADMPPGLKKGKIRLNNDFVDNSHQTQKSKSKH